MRGLVLVLACLLAGCVTTEPPRPEPASVDVLGSVVSGDATILPATVGDAPAPPLRVGHAGVETDAKEGAAVSLRLSAGGATLRLINHGDWVRTSLRWTEQECLVGMRTPTVDQTRDDPRIPVDNAVGPEHPYVEYWFSGSCSGQVFVLWRG